MYTEEQWENYSEMEEILYNVAGEWVRLFGDGGNGEYVKSATTDGCSIQIETEDNWAYGGHSTDSYSMSARYLWTENWLEEMEADHERERIVKETADHQKLIDKRNEEIAKEQAKYLELHKKYGGVK